MKDEKESQNEAENIRVAVRCRPMNERELREQASSCFLAQDGNAVLTNLENPTERHEFGFDYVYGIDTPQIQVFQDIGAPILDKAFGGYNGTIFAYGQTGSGKTFSMNGIRGHDELEGLIPRMNRAIFERIAREKVDDPQKLFLVECSFFEIYNEVIFDLLDSSGNSKKNKAGLEIKEHPVLGIYVKDLQERVVESRDEVVDLMTQGQNARTVGYTQMNAESSRSHSIFIIKIHQKDATDESKNIFAKINLVDLAGSERAASTGAQGDRLKEGANINKSLSALGNVINALVEASRSGKKVFIPYRNSKLTRVLQESLGGNSLCSMVATLSPANINFVETLSTLKYASRAKAIKVNAKKNEASSQISQLNEEIAALKKKLTEQTSATLGLDPKEKEEIVKKYEQQIKEMDRIRLQTWEDKTKLSKQHELERKRLAKEKALADQKVREERTRKWKLLEEKGDVELMLRALRDLDRATPNQAAAGATTGCTSTEDKWLTNAQEMKALETEAKDHRTMIMVFKDAVDKDVDQWSKRLVRHENTTSAAAKRDDTAATHMIVNQLCSKLQNVFDESKQLVQMEKKLIEDGCDLINEMMSELIKFKEKRKLCKAVGPKPSTAGSGATAQQSKEEDQVQEEREKGLSMTLALIQRQRAKLVTTIRSERQKMFNLAKVSAQFVKYMDSYIVALESVRDAEALGSLDKWKSTKESLANSAEAWESELPKTKKLEDSAATAADAIPVTYVPKGEISALGLESKLVGDDCLYTSSRKPDAKLIRMNCPQFWLPDEQDAVPFAVVDLEFPRFVQSVAIRGGNTAGSPPISTSGSLGAAVADDYPRKDPTTSTPPTTFQLKSPEELEPIAAKYKFDNIPGDGEPLHELLGNVLSWNDLIKSTTLPVKLFSRPPVRFVHDIVSVVINNTGYAKDLFSVTERNYFNLNTKTERADYLTKILDFVQEDYRTKGDETVVIAATASNILAGKEPADTLKFLGYFGLAALLWGIKNPPVKPTSSVNPGVASQGAESTEVGNCPTQPDEPETKKTSGRSGWVRKMRISTSLTGKQWRVIGDFDANIDDVSLQTISFPPGTNAVGRFVQLTCVDWHELPLFQVEIYGQEASESDELVKSMDGMGSKASHMIQQLLLSAALFAEEARASWEKAKDAEREKQEELIKLMAEITRLKQANAQFEKDIKAIQQSKATLQQSVKTESKKFADEKAKNEKLQAEVQLGTACIAELKKEKESLGVKLNEHTHSIQTITLQMSEQKKEMEMLLKSKTDLEDLSTNLRNQLQSKNALEGHQESKLASVMSDFMAVNVQLDEFRRRYETSEQMRKEQEAASQQMHTQLQNQLSELSEKENAVQKQLQEKITSAERALEVAQSEKDELRRRVDESAASATVSNAATEALRVQLGALQDELEAWKKKATEAQERASPTTETIEAASVSNNAQENEQLLLELQTKELRYVAELEKSELKLQACEQKQRETDAKLLEIEQEKDALARRVAELGEQEEELQFQLQIVTEERDAARAKEEQLFMEGNEKDQEIERIRDGYVWVTDRMNMKEDELAELQEQLEKYQVLLQITTPSKKREDEAVEAKYLMKLYTLAIGQTDKIGRPDEMAHELSRWIEHVKKSSIVESPALNVAANGKVTSKAENAPKANAVSSKPTTTPENSTESAHKSTSFLSNGSVPEPNHQTANVAATLSPEKTSSPPSQPVEPIKSPTIKAPLEPNHGPVKEAPKQPEEIPKPTKSPRSSPLPKLDAKPELEASAPTKPATPRRESTPPTSSRRLSGNANNVSPPSNQHTRSDDAYDDDFDPDEPETEAKRQLRRKESGTA